jgi:putative membrane protein
MVQHVLLVLVAAPLLVLSPPSATLLRGTPSPLHKALGPWRGRLGQMWRRLPMVRNVATLWLPHTGRLWFWHAALPYETALNNEIVHVTEHVSFLVTALLFWHIVIGVRATERVPQGLGAMLVFAMALQSGFLSLLLTICAHAVVLDDESVGPGATGGPTTRRSDHVDPSRFRLPRGRAGSVRFMDSKFRF